MLGSHHIIIESPRLKYEFTIKRFITLIQGDTATGKTTLIDLIQEFARNGFQGPVRIQSDVSCSVFYGTETDWGPFISNKKNNIIFIDEGFSFIRTKAFAESIKGTDNYYVLITREALPCLPYSINEIYGIRTSGKYHFPEKIYHEFYPIYDNKLTTQLSGKIKLITEDSKAGFTFLKAGVKDEIECISANGNSNIYQVARKMSQDGSVIIVADGAAFGAFIDKLVKLASYNKKLALYLPESFEWLVLKSGIINYTNLQDIIENPENYADTVKHFSWEQFFTHTLESATCNDPIKKYQKNNLLPYYTESKNQEKILAQFPAQLRNIIHH